MDIHILKTAHKLAWKILILRYLSLWVIILGLRSHGGAGDGVCLVPRDISLVLIMLVCTLRVQILNVAMVTS